MSKPTLLNNRYRILKAIGEGKYDNTFIGEDTRHPAKQRCVVKQLKPRLYNAQTEPQLKENILREAKALAAIGSSHSQIPTLQAYFAEQGLFYLIYDWTEGTLLSQVKNLPWPEAKVSSFVVSLLGALAHLHKNNLIHQNLNPDNIIIRQQDQQPHLIYFGAVKALVNRAGLNPAKTGASVIVKTRGFMSPEQAMGRAIPSSNLYSLGMTAIYLLTGQSPLRIPTDKHNGRLLWRQLAPTVGDRTAGIFTRAIHTNPAIRFANATEMQSVLTQTPIAQPSSSPAPSPQAITTSTPRPEAAPTRIAQNTAQNSVQNIAQNKVKNQVQNSLEATEVSLRSALQSTTAVAVAAPPKPTPQQLPQKTKKSVGAKIDDFFRQLPLKWVGLSLGGAALVAGIVTLGSQTFSSEETIDASSLEQIETNISDIEAELEGRPNDESLNLQLAENYAYAGDIEAADTAIETALEENANSAEALYQKGRLLFYQSDYEQAIEVLTEATEQDERHAKSTIMLGRAYQETGEYDVAQSQFEAATGLRGSRGEAYLNLSYLKNLQGDIQAAIDAASQASKHFKGDRMIRAYAQLGTLYFDLKDIERAEENWENAVSLSPQNPQDYVVQSISKFFLSDSEGALENIDQALSINPNFSEAYAMRSIVHLNKGEINPAVTAIDKAVEIDEYSVSTLKIIADVALSLPEPNLDFAFSAINQALDINPNSPYILNQRCNILMSVRQLEEAIADCTRSIEINPNNIEAYNTRGQAHIAQSDFTSAETDFTRIIEINNTVGRPQDAAAYAQRAVARTGLQDPEGAKADLDTALELNSQL